MHSKEFSCVRWVNQRVEVVGLWLAFTMYMTRDYELYDNLVTQRKCGLTSICVNISMCTFIPPCNFDMRPYLQFDKFGVIFKAAFESRQRRSPDMDEAPENKTWCQSGCGWFRFRFFNGDVWWRWLVPGCDGFFHKKSTAAKGPGWQLASCNLRFAQLHTWVDFCGDVLQLGKEIVKQPEGWYPMKGTWFILWEGFHINGLSWEACLNTFVTTHPPHPSKKKHLLRSMFCFFQDISENSSSDVVAENEASGTPKQVPMDWKHLPWSNTLKYYGWSYFEKAIFWIRIQASNCFSPNYDTFVLLFFPTLVRYFGVQVRMLDVNMSSLASFLIPATPSDRPCVLRWVNAGSDWRIWRLPSWEFREFLCFHTYLFRKTKLSHLGKGILKRNVIFKLRL